MEMIFKLKNKKIVIFAIIFLLLGVLVLIFLRGDEDTWIKENGNWVKHGNPSSPAPVENFEECAKLYPIMETYPEQCRTPDGKNFTKQY